MVGDRSSPKKQKMSKTTLKITLSERPLPRAPDSVFWNVALKLGSVKLNMVLVFSDARSFLQPTNSYVPSHASTPTKSLQM